MNFASTALLAAAMSTDAFAAAIAIGSGLDKPKWREALRSGAIFGAIEATTPVLGWLLGSFAAQYVVPWAHWIAFTLLAVLGVKMIVEGFENRDDGAAAPPVARRSFISLAATGLATSIDAMAVGVGLSLVDVDIVAVAAAIGAMTFAAVTAGVMLGRVLGSVIGKRAEVAGGVILIGIGAAILYQHLTAAAAG